MMRSNPVVLDIDYYDAYHKQALLQHKYSKRIDSIVSHGLSIDAKEFLVYAMFTEQADRSGFKNYSELKSELPSIINHLRNYIDVDQGTIKSKTSAGLRGITERVGVSTALMLMNYIFGLHQADWERIPETSSHRTLDFQIAANGEDFVMVEAKGTIVSSGNLIHIARLKESIESKKNWQREHLTTPSSLFGVITGIPYQQSINAKCLLLDPPLTSDEDPKKYQLLARLSFYTRLLSIISPGQIVRDMQNRIRVLNKAKDYNEFDGLSLVDIYGKQIIPPPENTSVTWNKTVNKNRMVGHMFPISSSEFIYFAVDMDIYRLIIEQKFTDITKFVSTIDRDFIEDIILDEAKVDISDLNKYEIEYDPKRKIDGTNKVSMSLSGSVHYNRSGLIFGFFNSPR